MTTSPAPNDSQPPLSLRRVLSAVFGAIAGLVALVLVVETADWVIERKWLNWSDYRSETNTRFHPVLGWETIPMRRNFKKPEKGAPWGQITANSNGFRSEEIDPNRKGILLIGDSMIWGWGSGDGNIASAFLNQLAAPHGLQIHNLGVSGYGPDQHALNLERHLGDFGTVSAVVLVISTTNDYVDATNNSRYGARKPLFRSLPGDPAPRLTGTPIGRYCLRNLFFKSYVLGVIQSAEWAKGLNAWLSRIAGDITLDRAEGERVTEAMLDRIAAAAAKKNAQLIVVLYPNRPDLRKESEDHAWFKKIVKGKGWSALDYRQTLLELQLPLPAERLYGDDGHFNTYGNKLFASAIAQKLRATGVLPNRPPAPVPAPSSINANP
jgi:lysophospholipase L1-like esterase